jgi:hypothetical protein
LKAEVGTPTNNNKVSNYRSKEETIIVIKSTFVKRFGETLAFVAKSILHPYE